MAKSVIGALRVNLGLDSAKFERGARRVETRTQKLARGFRNLAAAGGVVGGALLALARRSANTIDEQSKLAQSLNTSTVSIQNLARAGELAGVSFGQVQQAVIQLERRLGQAAIKGTGPAIDSLEALGLTLDEIADLDVDEQITIIQDRLQKFVPEANRAAVAAGLFGDRAGVVFSRIDGSVLRQAAQDVRDFGVAVTEVEADQIERTNDAISALSLIAVGLGNQIAVALAPALERLANGLREITKEGTLFSKAIDVIAGNADKILIALGALAGLLAGKLAIAIGTATIGFLGLFGPIGAAVGIVAAVGVGFTTLAGILGGDSGSYKDASSKAAGAQDALNTALETFRTSQAPDAANKVLTLANANYELQQSALAAAKAEIAKGEALIASAFSESGSRSGGRSGRGRELAGRRILEEGQANLAKAQQAVAAAARQQAAATIELSESQVEWNTETGKAVEIAPVLTEETKKITDALKGAGGGAKIAKTETEKLGDELEQAAITGEEVADGLAGVFTDAITGARTLREGVQQLAASFGNQLLQQGFKQLLGAAVGGGAGGGAGFLAGLIPGFATGTRSAPGGLAMVGERGPELVNLPKGSQVFDAQRSKGMMKATAPTVNVDSRPQVVVLDDPKKVGQYLNGPEGERDVVNIMNRNN